MPCGRSAHSTSAAHVCVRGPGSTLIPRRGAVNLRALGKLCAQGTSPAHALQAFRARPSGPGPAVPRRPAALGRPFEPPAGQCFSNQSVSHMRTGIHCERQAAVPSTQRILARPVPTAPWAHACMPAAHTLSCPLRLLRPPTSSVLDHLLSWWVISISALPPPAIRYLPGGNASLLCLRLGREAAAQGLRRGRMGLRAGARARMVSFKVSPCYG